jgi:hypothetical protein
MSTTIKTIKVQDSEISLFQRNEQDYISLTDIARLRNSHEPKDVVKNWLRNRSTIEFLGLWEKINNPNFKGVEFDPLLFQSGSNSFTLSPSKWIEATNAIGIVSKIGRGGGTYAQRDIAFEFASWISSEFKLYLIKEFQRLKEDEQSKQQLEWNVSRILAKVNYRIHTDAIKENLIPPQLSKRQVQLVYASEADLLNMALFGKTAAQWRSENARKEGNIRDYATLEQLVVLANMESINAMFIQQGMVPSERLENLNRQAILQMKSLLASTSIKTLK